MCPPEKERTEEQKKQAKIVEQNISVSKQNYSTNFLFNKKSIIRKVTTYELNFLLLFYFF